MAAGAAVDGSGGDVAGFMPTQLIAMSDVLAYTEHDASNTFDVDACEGFGAWRGQLTEQPERALWKDRAEDG